MEQLEVRDEIRLSPIQPFELKFEHLNVVASIEQEYEKQNGKMGKHMVEKCILEDCTGIFSPGHVTAIVGPSGCGKTTLLNLLSARLLSTNLTLSGQLFVNQKEVYDVNIYGDKIGYVMQEDLLFATFTPRECFQFIADMRLVGLSKQERTERVEETIQVLGLAKCADTFVGNALIRGISGGEKKRTSIGVELLINPSIIFLDEPTTGLDSTTALNVIRFLNKLAKSGRTVVSTIHQPSSQIFAQFDKLIIMVQGSIVYQGSARESMTYFQNIGFPIPHNSNPTDFYMKIMNKEGIALNYIERGVQYTEERVLGEFAERINYFKAKYAEQNLQYVPTVIAQLGNSDSQGFLPFCGQFSHIFVRALKNELRNPMDVRLRVVQQIVQAVVSIVLYYKPPSDPFSYIQNVSGCLFFFTVTATFAGVFANLSSFITQRSIFIRERMNNTYTTSAYFWGKSSATFPVQIIVPFVYIVIAYFACNLNNQGYVFFWAFLTLELVHFCAASYSLMISTLIKDLNVAMSLTPITIIPLMLVAGFFNNLTEVPKLFYPLEYISMFKYGFQALVQNQYRGPIDCGPPIGKCDILTEKYNFPEPFWLNLLLLGLIGIVYRCLALLFMHLVSSPTRVHLEKPDTAQEQDVTAVQIKEDASPEKMSAVK